MNLQTFIKETLVSIQSGIVEANSMSKGKNSDKSSPDFRIVDQGGKTSSEGIAFDIAVIASESGKKEGGAGINVISTKIGGSLSKDSKKEEVSRIKFIVFPYQNIK